MDELDLGATIKGFSPGQKVFGRYTLKKILGRGGMGVVWLAHDDKLERDVALKFLPEVMMGDKLALADLKRETRRSLDLTHSHIVRIYDFVEDGRTAAIAMEYITGETLTNARADRPGHCYEPPDIAKWVGQICDALDYAHTKAKVVHRDLKPANLMIDAAGDVKVTDFGIATSIADSVSRVSKQAGSSGTPVYMAPQQMMGDKPSVTDDVYSLGATLYELLTGKPPFYTGNVFMQVQNKVPPTVAARREELGFAGEAVPAQWEATLAACLAKEPQARPQGAAEVAVRLGLREETGRRTGNPIQPPVGGPDAKKSPAKPLTDEPGPRTISRSRSGLYAGLVAAALVLGGLGWYFGIHVPEQKRIADQTRIEAERLATENRRIKAEQERAQAAEKEKQDRAAAEAKTREEAKAHASILGQIEALRDGAPESQKISVERAVAAYLTVAPGPMRREAENTWATRLAGWQAAKLAAARGGFVIRTIPAGADLQVDSFGQGMAPLTVREFRVGRYPVRARLAGYEEANGVIEVKDGAVSELELALVRSTGVLVVDTDPVDVELEVTGRMAPGDPPLAARQVVRSPAQLTLPAGSYEVVMRRDKWPEQRRQVTVSRAERTTISADFVGATVRITSDPAGAEVLAGGKVIGRTPLVLSDVVPGDQEYVLRLAGYTDKTVRGSARSAQSLSLSADLPKRGPGAGEKWTIPGLAMELLPVAPGSFAMGAVGLSVTDAESPVTRVTFTRPYWLGKTEVTQDQWQQIMGRNPSGFTGAQRPVESVTYTEALEFCRLLTERERAAGRIPPDLVYTLPSEAQWEFACRAGSAEIRPPNFEPVAWHKGNSGGQTHPVATKAPNAWGFHDMLGNVEEWCFDAWDGWARYPGGEATDYVALPREQSLYFATRGGSWDFSTSRMAMHGGMRFTLRGLNPRAEKNSHLGFRVALSRPHGRLP